MEVIFYTLLVLFILYDIINRRKKKFLNDVEEKLKQKVIDNIPKLYTEVKGNTIYLFEKETDVFQCQATTMEELAELLVEIKKTELAKVDHNNQELWFVDGDVLDEIELKIKVVD
jgi:hypothetical protein